jgi:hypothetical protein
MKLRSRVSVLAVASLIVGMHAFAQDDVDNLGNIDGANSIENSKKSSGNSSNNVLDSEELNSSSNNVTRNNSMNNAVNSLNGNIGGANSGNNDLNSELDANAGENLGDNGGISDGNTGNNLDDNLGNAGSNTSGISSNAGSNLGNGGNAAGTNGGGSLNGNGTGFDLNGNGSNKGNAKSATAAGNNAPANLGGDNPPNTGASEIPPPPEPTPAAQPKNAVSGPDAGSIPPPPETPKVDPNAVTPAAGPAGAPAAPVPEAAPLTAAEKRKLAREEKRKARLELIKKMAESIPALREGEAPLEYTVQPGDTLWDISDQLLDDASWWPKLWVLNPELTDPDKIEPGTRLLFYPATKTDGPELAAGNSPEPISEPKVELATLQTFNMDVQSDKRPKGELIDPSSIDKYQNLLIIGDPMLTATYMFRVPGFYASGVDPVGEIISDANSPMLAGQGQNLIARFDRQTPRPGERYLVIRETPIFTNLDPIRPDGNLFTHTGTVGVVRVSASGYATLVAEEASSHIAPSDLLIPLNKNLYVPVNPASAGRPNQAAGFVVATEGGSYQSAGPGIAVYLQSAGGRNPFQVGDDVELYMPSGSTFGFTDNELTERENVATARIVEAGPDSAVGVILRARREVTAGASTVPNIDSIR